MLEVGQKLWLVLSSDQPSCQEEVEVIITGVGRRWANIDRNGYRIDLDNLTVDGGGFASPGRCYLSQEVYPASVARQRAREPVHTMIHNWHRVPEHLSLESIEAIQALLKPPTRQE